MVTIAELKEWQPDKLTTISDTLNNHRRALTYLQSDIDDSKPPKSWIGSDASAAATSHTKLASDIYDDVAELTAVVEALDTAGPEIKSAKDMLDNALTRAKGNHFEVSADGTVSEIDKHKVYPDQGAADAAQKTMQDIAGDIGVALQKATDADNALAEVLGRAQRGDVDATGNLKDMSVEDILRGMTTAQQVAYLSDHPGALKKIADTLPPEVQQGIANRIAPDLGDGHVDPKTVQIMAALEHEHPFTKTLFDQVGPDQIQEVVNNLSDDAYPEGHVSSDADKKAVQEYKDFLSAAGAGFATYTKGTGVYAPPGDLVGKWTDAIENGKPGEASALTLMLKAGGQTESYSKDFIAPLTDKIYDWERSQDGPVWGPRDQDPGLIDPFLTTDDHMFSNKGGYIYASDGMANLLGSMGHSPDAAQQFFSDDHGGVDEDKMKYLVTERTFSSDHQSDEGNGLGAAVSAAAIGKDGHTPWNAKFATDLFQTIADKSGSGDSHLNPVDDAWHVWPGMTDDLGKVGASYVGDVYDQITLGETNPGDAHLQFSSTDELDKVLGEIGRGDKTGIETLSAAAVIEGDHRNDEAISEWEDRNPGAAKSHDLNAAVSKGLDTQLAGVGEHNGQALAHIINHSVGVDLDDEELAKTRAEYTSKAIDMATSFVPGGGDILGEGANKLATDAIDLGKDQAIDQLKNHVASAPPATAHDYVDSNRAPLEQQLKYNTVDALMRHGYVHDVPPSITTSDASGHPQINQGLYDADGDSSVGAKGQYTPAQLKQMQDDWYEFRRNNKDAQYLDGITAAVQNAYDKEANLGLPGDK